MGQAVKFVVNKGHQSFESTVVSQTPSLQQARYFVGRGRRGFVQTAHTPPLGAQGYHSPTRVSTTANIGIAVFPLISRIKEQMRFGWLTAIVWAKQPIYNNRTSREPAVKGVVYVRQVINV